VLLTALLLHGEEVGLFSNLFLKEETLPVTTGDGDRLRRLSRVPVPVRPRYPRWLPSVCSVPEMDSCLFLSRESKAGLGLLVLEKGVVQRGLGPVRATGIFNSAVRCSNRSLVLVTEPWLAPANMRLGLGLLEWSACGVWVQPVHRITVQGTRVKL
jgi:hypothetical protein